MQFKKGEGALISKYFKSSEFDCQCECPGCAITLIDERLLKGLEEIRKLSGPLKITSGFRCLAHNIKVGGVNSSKHLTGEAADISSKKLTGPELAKIANEVECFKFGGMGIAQDWIHIDVRPGRARWTYPTKRRE